MAVILNIDTTTKLCSVAISNNGEAVALREHFEEQYSHAEKLNVLIEECFKESEYDFSNLDAIAVSDGPGSYTGLRIGAATAKGLCYALSIPLIKIDTLHALSIGASKVKKAANYRPMIDARRMEVYTSLFDEKMNKKEEIDAIIVEKGVFSGEFVFFGDGAEKCVEVLGAENFINNIQTSAKYMTTISEEKFQNNDFVDLAYYEPNYFKKFIAGKPKKLL